MKVTFVLPSWLRTLLIGPRSLIGLLIVQVPVVLSVPMSVNFCVRGQSLKGRSPMS